jgi:tetratricopeptide (TPR) repeat protein
LYGQSAEGEHGHVSTLGLHRVTEVQLSLARDETDKIMVEIGDDDVVAVELEGNFVLWMRGDELQRELGETARDGSDELTLKTALGTDSAERGLGGWLLKGLKIFGIDPAEQLVIKTAERIEAKNQDTLLRLDPTAVQPWTEQVWNELDGPPADQAGAPLLLFLHGTFSSTLGSFGELFKLPGPMQTLAAGYPGRIYGFEHPTLTKSPIANALALTKKLPADTRLHLVSHSRGGLVGDLLCLASVSEFQAVLSPEYLQRLSDDDRRDLPLLIEELRSRRIQVERFVRVASPSRGTTLASGRLDRWLSVVFNLISKVPVLSGAVADVLMEFILAVVKEPQDAETLPGLEAMMPQSPLVGLLNHPDLQIPEPVQLAVISGDIQEQGIWGRLKLLIPDLFFAGDHDLVVNTGSMYGGLRRAQAWFCFDQGANVNHFNYFGASLDEAEVPASQPITVDALLLGLLDDLPGRFYKPLAEAPVITPARSAAGVSGRRPVLFVLPGIMGSSLAVRDATEEVWLSVRRLALGQITRLRMDQPLSILPTGLLGLAYGDLVAFMDRSHDVLPFPYDWRQSVRNAARHLADEVGRALDLTNAGGHPVRILAHSMGGLVARAMIAERPDLWQRVRERGGRLVMLGTPNRGSWEIVRLLVAQAATLKQLALLDVPHDRQALLAVIRDFPGLLELLPEDRRDFLSDAVWRSLRAHDEAEQWHVPGQGRPSGADPTWLEQARKARAWLRDRAIDPQGMVYVAGEAPETASDVFETVKRRLFRPDQKTLGFFVSARGDSSVLWDDGLLPGVPTWYAPGMSHGDLAKDRALFNAIEDLLVQGQTADRVLQRDPPVAREADQPRPMLDREPAYYPDEETLIRTALAISLRRPAAATRFDVQVRVTHGNLAFAEHRVAVGHYQGDTIIAAEAYLDHVLDGRLGARHDLGLYPGALGTHAVFDHPAAEGRPPGALVVGLGDVGELTASTLSATFARALLELARHTIETPACAGGGASNEPHRIAVSSLLIGTGAGGIGIRDSVLALLRGVTLANRTLDQTDQAKRARIAAIEFIELLEGRAIDAVRALHQIDDDPELSGGFTVTNLLHRGAGGQRSVVGVSDDPAWWHRLQVLGEESGSLRFTLLTQRARAEETLIATQAELVDRFVERANAGTAYDPDVNRTLFEMLLPVRLKDGSELRTNLVLVLDEKAARYPWEMLEDRWSQPLPGQPATSRAERSPGRGRERKPRSVEFGVLRQLKTRDDRARPVMSPGQGALVIGDPKSDYVPLPGARDEAKRVTSELEKSGYRVNSLIEPTVDQVMVAVHADAYRVLHLAGHGVHRHRLDNRARPLCNACGQLLPEKDEDLVSGMIIGEGMVLTPGDVEQMRRVPELVFINCCHLGRSDQDPWQQRSDSTQAHRLAANLAVQFIKMGVRAVIAAGWAVQDQAAQTFAETFYRHMSKGQRFGEAVRLARTQTWQEHRYHNTWGAYQCYGDPDFRLRSDAGGGEGGEGARYVSPAEALVDLGNLRADAECANPKRMARLQDNLRDIERALDAIADEQGLHWCDYGDVAEALGLAQGELGRFADAVAMLDRAIAADDAGASWNAIEQRVRYQARHAKALCLSADKDEREAGLQLFERALKSYDTLDRHPERKLTVMRYQSQASVHWRRVQVLPAGERADELKALVAVLERAARDLKRGVGDPLDPFSRLLWLAAQLMLTAYGPIQLDDSCPTFAAWCSELKRRAPGYERAHPSAPAGAIAVEVQLLEHLEQGDLAGKAGALVQELRHGLRRGASQRQVASILDYVELLQVLAADATHKRKRFRSQAASLAAMVEVLRDWHSGKTDDA